MILVVEGAVGSGKTSFLGRLGDHWHIIPEYEPACVRTVRPGEWATQMHYLDADIARRRAVNELHGRSSQMNIATDRSIVSQAAHVWTLSQLSCADNRTAFCESLERNRGVLVQPDAFVLLNPPEKLRRIRLRHREAGPCRMDTDQVLMDHEYCSLFGSFLSHFLVTFDRFVAVESYHQASAATYYLFGAKEGWSPEQFRSVLDILIDMLRAQDY